MRIRAIYAADERWRRAPAAERTALRDVHVRPLVDELLRVGTPRRAGSHAGAQPRDQGARLRAQPGGRAAARPRRRQLAARQHARRARATKDRRRSEELDVLRQRHARRGRGGDLQHHRLLPAARPRSVQYLDEVLRVAAVLAAGSLPRARAEALASDTRAAKTRRSSTRRSPPSRCRRRLAKRSSWLRLRARSCCCQRSRVRLPVSLHHHCL